MQENNTHICEASDSLLSSQQAEWLSLKKNNQFLKTKLPKVKQTPGLSFKSG